MKNSKSGKITVAVIVILLVAVAVGFIYDGVMTFSERKSYPRHYQVYVSLASVEFGVPEYIIFAVIKSESNFDAETVSSDNAVGLMQLTEPAVNQVNDMLGRSYGMSSMYSPKSNIDCGTAYLSWLKNYVLKDSDWFTICAAYNAGPTRVLEWLADSSYSDDGKNLKSIPYTETSRYVSNIRKAVSVYKKLYYI